MTAVDKFAIAAVLVVFCINLLVAHLRINVLRRELSALEQRCVDAGAIRPIARLEGK